MNRGIIVFIALHLLDGTRYLINADQIVVMKKSGQLTYINDNIHNTSFYPTKVQLADSSVIEVREGIQDILLEIKLEEKQCRKL